MSKIRSSIPWASSFFSRSRPMESRVERRRSSGIIA